MEIHQIIIWASSYMFHSCGWISSKVYRFAINVCICNTGFDVSLDDDFCLGKQNSRLRIALIPILFTF